MQPLFNALYVMTPNAYAHPENATLRVDASCDFRGLYWCCQCGCNVIRCNFDQEVFK